MTLDYDGIRLVRNDSRLAVWNTVMSVNYLKTTATLQNYSQVRLARPEQAYRIDVQQDTELTSSIAQLQTARRQKAAIAVVLFRHFYFVSIPFQAGMFSCLLLSTA